MIDPDMSWKDAVETLRKSVNALIDAQEEAYAMLFLQEAQADPPNAALVTQMGVPTLKKSNRMSRITLDQRIEELQNRLRYANNTESNEPNG
ncbi:hypothetical protein Isop_1838 [Isosphaera pallida ATCC 43644]|uniref:Uncharacterized protein n=1 Tax=Isosphaera pallida (strain ATCC 43644 / DSM 9630 / IS1B) TaxID=575540 RepID=E8R1Y8_ISOPI|nr:hypothetical protein [Isosphaera pallida]ADV62420.1 hypothetical protein Isop_1838 [Isosphaera pallida ATCC 43644]